MTPQVSVVVPTYKRPDLLSRCLTHLLLQDLNAGQYEIIVVDDARDPSTEALIRSVTGRARRPAPPVRCIPVQGAHGPARARNQGWRAAAAPVIAFTDDDTLPDRHWLSGGLKALADGADAAWGRIMVPCPNSPTDYERDAAGLATAGFVTANCFARRQALDAVGGFDEQFQLAWREDSDLYFSLLEHRKRVVYTREALVIHPIRAAQWGVSLRQQRKSLFDALLYKKHPELCRRHSIPSVRLYYGIVLALLAAALLSLEHFNKEAAVMFALWAVLTAEFLWRRLAGTSRSPGHLVEMLVTSILIPPIAVFWRFAGAVRFRVLFI